ncbi:MAG: oxidoreductase [Bryobacterales bacterium]|nr:oxidoreductase [Bryobacterales bacterium]
MAMPTRTFGPTGRQVPVIGQGTWNLSQASAAQDVEALRRGIDLGLTHIDTAEMYGTERTVGEAIKGRRKEVFLVSKVLPSNASRNGTIQACERSLKALQTDHLDCYLLHWRGSTPLAETFAAFEDLRLAGSILSWGVSNFDVDDLDEALHLAGPGVIACNQVLYHAGERAIEHAVMPWCEKHGVAVVAYSPFGSGSFPRSGTPGRQALNEVALVHGVTPRQVALAFVTRSPNVFTIPKAAAAAHVEDNAAAANLQLGPADVARLERAFPKGPKPRSLPMI